MGQGLFVGLGPLRRSSRDSCSIVGAIPVDETAKAGLDGSIGLEADITGEVGDICGGGNDVTGLDGQHAFHRLLAQTLLDRKSTRMNSSQHVISYAVFCLKKKNNNTIYDVVGARVTFSRAVPHVFTY